MGDANAIQQENERIKEACRRNSLAASFFRAKAAQSDIIVKEIFSALESAKAKIAAVVARVSTFRLETHASLGSGSKAADLRPYDCLYPLLSSGNIYEEQSLPGNRELHPR
jgi:hypothetical protein